MQNNCLMGLKVCWSWRSRKKNQNQSRKDGFSKIDSQLDDYQRGFWVKFWGFETFSREVSEVSEVSEWVNPKGSFKFDETYIYCTNFSCHFIVKWSEWSEWSEVSEGNPKIPLNFFIFKYVEGEVLGNNYISIKKCTTTFLWVLNFGQVGKILENFQKHPLGESFWKMVSKVIFWKNYKGISL